LDLAVALALAGATTNLSLPADLVAFGEVGLAGEIRSVAGVGRRLAEASRMGFRRAIVPLGTEPVPADSPIEVTRVADVRGAISAGLGSP
jgi:DNA repair protein RadA/Sms